MDVVRSERARFALLCDGASLDPWAARAIEQLRETNLADLVAVLIADPPAFGPRRSSPVVRLYERRRQRRRSAAAVALDDVAPGVPRIATSPTRGPGFARPAAQDSDTRVRALALDFVLAAGVDWPSRLILELPHGGIWAFDFDLSPDRRLGLDEIRRVVAGGPVVEIALLRLEPGGAATLRHGVFRGDGRRPHRGRMHIQAESASWPALVLANGPTVASGRRAAVSGPAPVSALTSLDLARFSGILVRNHLRAAWNRFFRHPQWNIGIVDSPIHAFLRASSGLPVRWYPLVGRRAFLADPFGVPRGSDGTVLCEHFEYRRGRGTIRAIEVSGGEFASTHRDLLRLPAHLSYPCTVEHAGRLLCVPEALETQEVALFEVDTTNGRLARVASIVRGVAAMDPTIFPYRGRWWLMFVDGARGTEADLHIWHAVAPDGRWSAHRANPVKTDVLSARPAGIPFEHDGRLYRPAQDCSQRYGARVVLNHITKLTPDEFDEEPVAWVEPSADDRFPAGRHTLTSFGERTLIDGHRFIFVPVALGHFVRNWSRDLRRAAMHLGGTDARQSAGAGTR